MTISNRKIAAFQKLIANLATHPNGTLSDAQLKAYWDSSPEELRVALNGLVDDLTLTTAGNSGADNVGAATIAGLTGATVQALLEALNAVKVNITGDFQGTLKGLAITAAEPGLSSAFNAHITDNLISVRDYGLTGVGVETALLNTALQDIASKHKIALIPNDLTITTNNITLNGLNNFGVMCCGTLKRPDNSDALPTLILSNCTNVFIPLADFDGNAMGNGAVETVSTVKEGLSCLKIDTCDHVIIGSLYALNPTGDGVYILNSTNVFFDVIHSKSTLCVGRNTLSIISGGNIFGNKLICDGTGHMSMPGGFDIEPNLNTQTVDSVSINYCWIKSAGTNPFSLLAANGSVVKNINVGSAFVTKIKKQNVTNNCCLITASNVNIDYLWADGASYDNLIVIDNQGTLCSDVIIKDARGSNVYRGMQLGFSGPVQNIRVKAIVRNCILDGVSIIEVANARLDIDIDSVGAARFMINKSGGKNCSGVYITGDISKRGTGTDAMICNDVATTLTNWTLDNLNFTGWALGTRIIGAGFANTLRTINCLNWNYGTAAGYQWDVWTQGNLVINTNPTELGTTGSKYVITGWICTVGGTSGTVAFVPLHALTGN